MRNLFGGDPYFNNVLSQCSLRGRLVDESPKSAQLSTSSFAVYADFGQPTVAGGLLSGFTFQASAAENFTIEGWTYLTTLGDVYQSLFEYYPFSIRYGNAGFGYKLQYAIDANSVTTVNSCSITQAETLNKWVHIAVVRVGTKTGLFVNGQLTPTNIGVNPSTYPNWWSSTSAEDDAFSYIGTARLGGNSFDGRVRDFRFTRGIARYTSNFIPPTSLPKHGVAKLPYRVPISTPEAKRPPIIARRIEHGGDPHFNNVVLQLPLRRSVTATEQISTRTISVIGNVYINPARAAFFEGTDDWILTDSHADFNPAGTWTAECWYFAVTTTSNPYILSAYQNASTRWGVQVNSGGTSGNLFVSNGTGNLYGINLSNQTLTGWQHFAITRDGQTAICTIFHNGAIVYRGTPSPDFGNVDGRMELGAAAFNSSNELHGYLVDVRYTKNIVRYREPFTLQNVFDITVSHPLFGNPQEFRLHSHGVASPAVRYIPIPMLADAARPNLIIKQTSRDSDVHFNNVVLQLPFRTNLLDYSKNKKTIVVNGNTKIINESAYFDGTGDGVEVAYTSDLDIIGTKFTIEFWNITPALATEHRMIAADGGAVAWNSTNGIHFLLQIGVGNYLSFQGWNGSTTVSVATPNNIIPLNTWAHIAITYDGAYVTIFVNGISKLRSPVTLVRPSSNPTFGVGCIPSEGDGSVNGLGYYRDVRITKGIVRYTSDFTPPAFLNANVKKIKILSPNIVTPKYSKVVYIPKSYEFSNFINYITEKDKYWSSVKAYLKLRDNFSDSSPNNVTVTDINTVNISNLAPLNYYGAYRSSNFIAANTEYLEMPANLIGSINTFTIECWCYPNGPPTVYPTASPSRWDLFGQGAVSGGVSDQFFSFHIDNRFYFYRGSGLSGGELSVLAPVNSANLNTWQHVVLQADGTNWKIFVNGKQVVSVASSTGWVNTGAAFRLGSQLVGGYPTWASYWNGNILDFRVTLNVARYTRNFVPKRNPYPTRS